MVIEGYDKIREGLLDRAGRHETGALPASQSVPERLLQSAWFHRRLQGPFHTLDGGPVKIIQPGEWNHGPGPDFFHAVLRMHGRIVSGDVEIHMVPEDWYRHGHHEDRAYEKVILHVVLHEPGPLRFTRDRLNRHIPTLVMDRFIPGDFEEWLDQLADLGEEALPLIDVGRCAEHFQKADREDVLRVLDAAGLERFRQKSRRWAGISRRAGRLQALWEGLCECLGYRENKTVFRQLAGKAPIRSLLALEGIEPRMALLFGMAGFLNSHAVHPVCEPLWKHWWKMRSAGDPAPIPSAQWSVAGLRPLNHPHRRLAAAAHLVGHVRGLQKKLETIKPSQWRHFSPPLLEDLHWQSHCSLAGTTLRRPTALLGSSRWREMTVNLLLPLAHAWATDPVRRHESEEVYASYPSLQDNRISRLAVERLQLSPRDCATARRHQGLIQIYQDFCLADRSDCQNCPFPELVSLRDKKHVSSNGS
ncbi:MAG: DUF2851 family protein [Verrucomicrobiae bacterium]|nr:DUF2851 family protein [Verrucomicrobiae bacterium]